MERRRLGRVGHMSSVIIYGGAMLAETPQEVADRSIELSLASGINHFDTAADYGDSELRLGPWMHRIRDQIFLASKTGDRTAAGAYRSIGRSLERLQVDRLDLIQLHGVCDPDDLDRAMGHDGAIEGAVRARDEGLVDAIGITGHGMTAPAVHLEALRRFPFETVITPYNYALSRYPDYLRDFEALVHEIRTQDAGLMLIKAAARNLWKTGEPHRRTTWYEPLEEQEQLDAAIAFALARDGATGICSPGDVDLLSMVVEAERRAGAMSMEHVAAELDRVPDLQPPFFRSEGHEVPEWLSPLLGGG
jgi:aryl-alcohol dehydrogenase-like predicted oxidoreductase